MEKLTSSEKITLSIILNRQKQKNAQALQMWERIRKEEADEQKRADALKCVIFYQNEQKEIESILKKVEGWSV